MDFCLKNYVTIKGCGSVAASGQYLNQLAGVSLQSVQKIADAEQITYIDVFNEIQQRAWNRLVSDYRIALRNKYKIKQDCDIAARICESKEIFLNAWINLLGAELMIERIHSPRINKLTTVDLDKANDLLNLFTDVYEAALNDIVLGTDFDKNDPCIECKPMFVRVERLP